MMFPLVQDLAAAGASPVAVTCRVLGFSKQAYYQWKKRPCSPRDASDARLINALRDAHDDDPTFGYRLLADEVVADGATASERRVWRLCHQEGIASEITTRKRGKGRRPGPAVHDDRVQREFTARGPNEIWLTDITEHATDEGKLYACAVKDVFAGKIVGYATGPRMTARLAVAALEDAVTRRGNVAGCIVHSDRGSQAVFNRSSQHRQREVFDGLQQHAKARARVSRADRLAGQADGRVARGPCPILGRDRRGEENARVRCRCGRVRASRSSLVPECWRRESSTPAQGIRALSLVSRA